MPESSSSLIFCDNCSSLALAEFEGSYLCLTCLLETVLTPDNTSAIGKVTPLRYFTTQTNRFTPEETSDQS